MVQINILMWTFCQGCPTMGHMWPRMARNAAQQKIINLLKTLIFAHQFLLVFVYLMCGPRQLFFFQCGPEMPKGWTPLLLEKKQSFSSNHEYLTIPCHGTTHHTPFITLTIPFKLLLELFPFLRLTFSTNTLFKAQFKL